MNRRTPLTFALVAALALASGCTTLKHTAVNRLGDALAAGGGTYSADDDPELIRAAAPFSLKLIESLLVESPQHRGLLLAATSGFTQYAYAFVQQDADEIESTDVAAAAIRRARARRLYLRARDYGLRGLDATHANFSLQLHRDPLAAVQRCRPADAPLLYWTAAAWAAAIAIQKDRPDLIAELPQAEALIDRAAALDDTFQHGAIHTFLITYETARPGAANGAAGRARHHFDRAVQLSDHAEAAPYVALAEAVCIAEQNRVEFETLLRLALAIDADAHPDARLANLVAQRRARWLLTRADDLFLSSPSP